MFFFKKIHFLIQTHSIWKLLDYLQHSLTSVVHVLTIQKLTFSSCCKCICVMGTKLCSASESWMRKPSNKSLIHSLIKHVSFAQLLPNWINHCPAMITLSVCWLFQICRHTQLKNANTLALGSSIGFQFHQCLTPEWMNLNNCFTETEHERLNTEGQIRKAIARLFAAEEKYTNGTKDSRMCHDSRTLIIWWMQITTKWSLQCTEECCS